jgi:hypothetical protein
MYEFKFRWWTKSTKTVLHIITHHHQKPSNFDYGLFFIIGLLDSPGTPDISSYLNMGRLTRWMMNVDLPLSRDMLCLLFQRLFESSLSHSSALHQLQDAIPILQKQSSSHLDVKALEPCVTLLQVISKVTSTFSSTLGHPCCVCYIN